MITLERRAGHNLIFLLIALVGWYSSAGQKATITKRGSSEVIVTRLTAYSDHHLHTSKGIFELAQLQSVRFEEKDARKADFFLEKLLSSGVEVVIGTERLEPTGPPLPLESDEQTSSPKHEGPEIESNAKATIGVGLGIDYGGIIGTRISYKPAKVVDIFAAVGYALSDDLGWNAGIIFNLLPQEKVTPTLNLMYGYNAVLEGSGKLYYGVSCGLGAKWRPGDGMSNLHFEVIVPFRADDAPLSTNASPVLLSIGYNIVLFRGR